VTGYGLTPSFQGAVTDYSVIVGTEVSSVSVGASAVASKAGVSGAGTYALNYGNNTINITCMSQSGSARTYTINVVRQQPAADKTQTPESVPLPAEILASTEEAPVPGAIPVITVSPNL